MKKLALVALLIGLNPAASRAESTDEKVSDLEQRIKVLERGEAEPGLLKLRWKKGPVMESEDKQISFKLRGRFSNDWMWVNAEKRPAAYPAGEAFDGTNIRRLRMGVEGELYERYEFESEVELSKAAVEAKDVWLGIKNVPWVGKIQFGRFKEAFSLEELTSVNNITFMERGLPNHFAPGRNGGVGLSDTILGKRLTWGVGAFRSTDDNGSGVDTAGIRNLYNVTGRIVGLPWYEKDSQTLFHVGAGYSNRRPTGLSPRYRQRPESNIMPRLVDTGAGTVGRINRVHLYGSEVAAVWGPISAQGEYIQVRHAGNLKRPVFDGWYIYASYFLTGESRAQGYKKGKFGAVEPLRSFLGEGGGWGAWEIALRKSQIDLNDPNHAIKGGRLDDITAGLNWYWNANLRMMWNYIYAYHNSEGAAQQGAATRILQTRIQVAW